MTDSANSPSKFGGQWAFEVFYDGECPLCKHEINMLRKWDRQRRLRFSDFTDPHFDWESISQDFDTLMSQIHGRFPDGTVATGVEVFRQLYTAVGFGWLVAPTRLPIVKQLLHVSYLCFAKLRPWAAGTNKACYLPAFRVRRIGLFSATHQLSLTAFGGRPGRPS